MVYEELWNDNLIAWGNKLQTYQTFKINFGWEEYLSAVTDRKHRVSLAAIAWGWKLEDTKDPQFQQTSEHVSTARMAGWMMKHPYNREQDNTGLPGPFVQSCFWEKLCFLSLSQEKMIYLFTTDNTTVMKKLAWFVSYRACFTGTRHLFCSFWMYVLFLLVLCCTDYCATLGQ